MRKLFAAALALVMLLLAGCGAGEKNDTPEALVQNYLHAVQARDYEAIWEMIPDGIRRFAMNEGIIANKEDGLDYICRAVYDYYWLAELDLASHESFSVEITQKAEEDTDFLNRALGKAGVRLSADEALFVKCAVTAGETVQEGGIFMIRSSGAWHLISVVGDDEFFEY